MKLKVSKYFGNPIFANMQRECVKGLPSVFNTQKRPWVSPQNATAEKIMEVIDRCPSRALTYEQK